MMFRGAYPSDFYRAWPTRFISKCAAARASRGMGTVRAGARTSELEGSPADASAMAVAS